ncbi:MAG: hypothetical protein Kow00117_06780 [Phototrophicales bacterium]
MIQQLMDEVNTEQGYGVFLMAQMDSAPDTLQFIIATTEFDETVNGLRDKHRYIVRCIGVQEHQIMLGMFKHISLHQKEEHPLLYQYNTTPVGLFFRGNPTNVNELILDVFQGYASTFGQWRHIPDYLNVSKPLVDVFSSGGDLVGEMPKPLADRLDKILKHHQLETKIIEGERHKEMPYMKALLLDESYVVAIDFSVDKLGKV